MIDLFRETKPRKVSPAKTVQRPKTPKRFGLLQNDAAAAAVRSLIDGCDDPSTRLGSYFSTCAACIDQDPAFVIDLVANEAIADEDVRIWAQQDPLALCHEDDHDSRFAYIVGDDAVGRVWHSLFDEAAVAEIVHRGSRVISEATTLPSWLGPLGLVALFLRIPHVTMPRTQAQRFCDALQKADASYKDDRPFWDVYRRRWWMAMDLLLRRSS